MVAYATPEQVARYLHTDETKLPTVVGQLLDDVGALIDARAPNASAEAKRAVSLARVATAITNPQGVVQRQIGDYSERYSQGVAESPLGLTAGDLGVLGVVVAGEVGGFAGSVRMPVPAVRNGRRYPPPRAAIW